MKKLLALLLALVLTSQLVTPVLAETLPEDTAAPTVELEEPTQMPVTEPPVPATLAPTEPATETPTTAATEAPETTLSTEPPAATEVPEVTDPTGETEATESTEATDPTDATDPTEETTETDLTLLAEDDILASGNCGAEADGSNVTWVLTTDGTMILSGTGAVAAYDDRKDTPWGDYNYQILRVEVQKGITSVSGFCSCYELQEVSLPEGLISIGKLTFMDCQKLQEIRLPKSLKTLGEGTFASCFALTEIEFPEGLETIGDGVLYHCLSLTSVVIPASVTEMGDRPFSGDWALKTVEIKGNVPRLSNRSFHECDALQEVLITGSVETIGEDAFMDLDSLERVQIASGLKTIGKRAFRLCDNLTTVSLPDGVTSIGEEAFKDCGSLTTINLPDSITTIGANAFNGTKLTGPLNIPSSLVSLGDNAFNGCGGITGTLLFPGALENISKNAFAGCTGVEEIILPRGVLFIGDGAFNNCSGVQRLWLTNSIKTIGASALSGMKSLKKIYFSGSLWDWDTGIQWADDRGYSNFPVGPTLNGETASGSCGESLTWSLNSAGDLTISGTGDMASFIATGAPWAEYRNQVKLVILGQGVTSIGSSAFQDCENLETVSLPGSLTALGEAAFLRCEKLTNVSLPISLKSVGEDCFTGCEKLVLLDLTGVPDEIMELRTSLEGTVTLPAGVKNARLRWGLETAAGEIPCSEIAEVCGQEGGYYLKMKSSGKVRLTCRDAMTGAQGSKTVTFTEGLMILPQGVDTLTSGEKLTLSAVAMPGAKKITARWFLVSGQEYATVTEKGVLTAGIVEEPTTVQVTAVLTGSTVRMTKQFTILPQVSQVTIQYRGNPAPAEQDISAEDGDTLRFKASTLPAEAVSPVQWRSSDEKVAVVDGGLVTLVGSGRAVITAQAMDGGKKEASVTLNVTYRDRTPRLVSTTVSLNGASTQGAELELAENYGNMIQKVSLNDDRFTANYENGAMTIAPAQFVSKGTYPVTLTVECGNRKSYDYDLTVKVTVALPKLTVKQEGKFNLFYNSYDWYSSAALIITGGQVEDVELDSEDFKLVKYDEHDDSCYRLNYKHADVSEKPNTKATLSVLFAGYNTPVTKTITIATENKAPKLTLNPTASVVNTNWGGTALYARAQLSEDYDYTSSVKITWDENPNVEKVELSKNTVRIALKEGAKSTTVNLHIQDVFWRRPVKLTHKITVTSKAPTLKLSCTKLTLNRVFPWMQAKADVTLNQGNLNGVRKMYFDPIPDGLRIEYNEYTDTIIVKSKDGETMPPKGKYIVTYRAQVVTWDVFELTGKLTINVEEKIPTVKLSSSTVKLNKRLAGKETATVKVSVSDPEHYHLQYFASRPEGVNYDSRTGELTVTLTESTMNGGTFQLNGLKLWMDGLAPSAELDKPLTLKIQTYDKAPAFKLSAKGKLDVLNPDSEIVYTPKLTNCLGAPAAVELTGDNADLFHVSLDSKGKIHLTLAKSGENYSTKTTYKVTPVLTACGQKITGAVLSVKVTQSAFKLAKLPNRTVFTTQSTNLTQKLTVASPAGAKMAGVTLNAKTTAALREAVRTAGGIRFDTQSGMITVPSGAFTNLKPGKYTLILDVKPENAASDAKPIQAQFTLTVRK